MAFSQADVAEVSKERHELLAKGLKAQITDWEFFRPLVTKVFFFLINRLSLKSFVFCHNG